MDHGEQCPFLCHQQEWLQHVLGAALQEPKLHSRRLCVAYHPRLYFPTKQNQEKIQPNDTSSHAISKASGSIAWPHVLWTAPLHLLCHSATWHLCETSFTL